MQQVGIFKNIEPWLIINNLETAVSAQTLLILCHQILMFYQPCNVEDVVTREKIK